MTNSFEEKNPILPPVWESGLDIPNPENFFMMIS